MLDKNLKNCFADCLYIVSFMYDEFHLFTYGMILLFDVLMTTMKSPHASKAVSLAMITAFTELCTIWRICNRCTGFIAVTTWC